MSLLIALAVALSTPCPAEDSTDCYWNAQTRGNGHGHSFIVFGDVVIRETDAR